MLFQTLEWVLGFVFLILVVNVRSQRKCGQRMMTNLHSGGSPWIWMVAITYKEHPDEGGFSPHCTGFLIDHIHVVTAAGCFFEDKNLTNYQTHIGKVDLIRGEVYTVVSVVIHEGYERYRYKDDVAILTLDRPVMELGFNPVCLPNEEVRSLNLDNEKMTVVGWGRRKLKLNDTHVLWEWNNILQQVRGVPVVSSPECHRTYGAKTPYAMFMVFPKGINEKMICTGFPTGGACLSTKGAFLMIQRNNSWYAVGILSYGACSSQGFLNIFTRVTEYLQWIWDNTWN